MSERVVVLCPGRGSYGSRELGSLTRLEGAHLEPLREWLDDCDQRRADEGLPGVREMDGSTSFSARLLRARNASALIFAVSVRDRLRLDPDRARVVAVGGNSMGWYSALYAAGALGLGSAGRLVERMAEATSVGVEGGQLIYPVVDDAWRPEPGRAAAVDSALRQVEEAGARAGHSIHYGGYAVLWADPDAIDLLLDRLPSCTLGDQEYPMRLGGNGPFHSVLMEQASDRGVEELSDLEWGRPEVSMIDGRGAHWRPLSTDPADLADYTLRDQVTGTFDFGTTVRVALREYAPDRIVLLGPGDTLGGAVAQVVIRERWRGIDSREAFLEQQRQDPFLISMARAEQAEIVAR